MQHAPALTVWDVITDFLATNPTPQAIMNFQLPEALQQRALDLLERNGEDDLTASERDEMFEFARADDVMALLKIKTEQKLRNSND